MVSAAKLQNYETTHVPESSQIGNTYRYVYIFTFTCTEYLPVRRVSQHQLQWLNE